jgi:hypothetical protein
MVGHRKDYFKTVPHLMYFNLYLVKYLHIGLNKQSESGFQHFVKQVTKAITETVACYDYMIQFFFKKQKF